MHEKGSGLQRTNELLELAEARVFFHRDPIGLPRIQTHGLQGFGGLLEASGPLGLVLERVGLRKNKGNRNVKRTQETQGFKVQVGGPVTCVHEHERTLQVGIRLQVSFDKTAPAVAVLFRRLCVPVSRQVRDDLAAFLPEVKVQGLRLSGLRARLGDLGFDDRIDQGALADVGPTHKDHARLGLALEVVPLEGGRDLTRSR